MGLSGDFFSWHNQNPPHPLPQVINNDRSTCLLPICAFIDIKNASSQNNDLTAQSPNLSQVPGHCTRIPNVCENVGYNYTQLPNNFNQRNHEDAGHEFSQFTRMIQSNCSTVLHVFLCSLYFTPCAYDANAVTPPCRSVCRAAQRDCEPWLKKTGFGWPYKFKCSSFPDPSDKTCVSEDGTINHGNKSLA